MAYVTLCERFVGELLQEPSVSRHGVPHRIVVPLNSMNFESIVQSGSNFDDLRKFSDGIGISAILVELRCNRDLFQARGRVAFSIPLSHLCPN